jgi:hypothetical protein
MTRRPPPAPLAVLGLLLLGLPGRAAAQVDDTTWEDPTLEAAVHGADLIVLGECTAVAHGGGAAYTVKKTLKGPPQDGKELLVAGLEVPGTKDEDRSVTVGDRAYLILHGDPAGGVLSAPTPTFGRFPIMTFGKTDVVVAAFSDTFTRVPVPPTRWEQVLDALAAGQPAPALLTDVRATVQAKDADPNDVYAALEVLGLFAEQADRPALEAVLVDPRFAPPKDGQGPDRFKVRISAARAIGRLGGAPAARTLVALVQRDPNEAVKSAAATALAPVLSALRGVDDVTVGDVTAKLAEVALKADATPIRPATATDPRTNQLDGLLGACLKTLAEARARTGVAPALRALERVDDGDALVAGLTFFTALGDPGQAGAVAWRMRRKGAEDEYFNPLFVRTLEALTHQQFGNDRAAWVKWCREQALIPADVHDEPLGPPAPPGAPSTATPPARGTEGPPGPPR